MLLSILRCKLKGLLRRLPGWRRGLRVRGRINLRKLRSIKSKSRNSRKDSTHPTAEPIIIAPTPEETALPIISTAHPTPTDTSHSVPNSPKLNKKTKSSKYKPPSSNK
jgi:hypothetical protein